MLSLVMKKNGLGVTEVAKLTGYSKTTVSKLCSGTYPNGHKTRQDILDRLRESGYSVPEEPVHVNNESEVFVQTENVSRIYWLLESLQADDADLTSSIGVVTGQAGRGKTFAVKRFAAMNAQVYYVFFVDGFSVVDVLREMAYEASGTRPFSFRACLDVIDEATRHERTVFVLDEADKMPKRYFDLVRSINERCAAPMVLVGEENLNQILQSERRLRSRVRDVVSCEPISIADVSSYYRVVLGQELDPTIARDLWRRSGGDFRPVVRDAMTVKSIMQASDLATITPEVVQQL